jgi:CubicO group peptidase (beta-lactamase class C family)
MAGIPASLSRLPQEILPHFPNSSIPQCGAYWNDTGCNRGETFALMLQHPPSSAPWITPQYSNQAFQLLGYILESLAGKNYSQIMHDKIFEPLKMSRSSTIAPPVEQGILPPVPDAVNQWTWSLSDETS